MNSEQLLASLVPQGSFAQIQLLNDANHNLWDFHTIAQQGNMVMKSVIQANIPTKLPHRLKQTVFFAQLVTSANNSMHVTSSMTPLVILVLQD